MALHCRGQRRRGGPRQRAILGACELLAQHPLVGHARRDLTSRAVLFWSSGSYLLVYAPETAPLRIIAVLHGARDVATILNDRD